MLLCSPCWYVLYTRPKFEWKVADEICELNMESYLPYRIMLRRWSDRIKKIKDPLFPNYVFARLNINEKSKVLQIPGVVKFVSFDDKPVYLKDYEIENIRRIQSADSAIKQESFYCEGDKVRVISGAFAGIEGILLKSINEKRLVIKFPIIKQAVSVEIDSQFVEKLD